MDETGFRIGIAKGQTVVTEEPNKRVYLPMAANRESLTVVEAISAASVAIPAMLVLHGKLHEDA